jgi:hypothetical protein
MSRIFLIGFWFGYRDEEFRVVVADTPQQAYEKYVSRIDAGIYRTAIPSWDKLVFRGTPYSYPKYECDVRVDDRWDAIFTIDPIGEGDVSNVVKIGDD